MVSLAFHALDKQGSDMADVLVGVGGLTEARTAEIYLPDWDNIWCVYRSGEPGYRGGRRVENLFPNSDAPASWSTIRIDVVTDDTSDPDGGNTGARCTNNDTNGSGAVMQSATLTDFAGRTFTDYFYIKYGNTQWVALRFGNDYQYFDVLNGILGTSVGSIVGVIEDAGSGWYKCWASSSEIATGTTFMYPAVDDDGDVGCTLNNYNFVWHPQLEDVTGQDDPAPSEHIPTTVGAVAQVYATKRRTNLVFGSVDLDDAGWTKSRTTVTAGQADPFGGTDAFSLNEDGTAANDHRMSREVTGTRLGETTTTSIYVKASNRTWMQMQVDVDGGVNRTSNFDVGTGVTGAKHPDIISTAIEAVVGYPGWYRCSATYLAAASQTTRFYIGESDGDITFDGLSQESLIIYGPQTERGSSATAPVATEISAIASSDFDTALAEVPWLYGGPAATNQITYSRDLTNVAWAKIGTAVVAYDAVGMTGAANTASTVTDDDAASYEGVSESVTIPNDNNLITVRTFIKKDADETRFPEIRPLLSGGTTQYGYIQLNTATGVAQRRASAGTYAFEVNDAGDWWEMLISIANNTSGNVTCTLEISAARGTTLGAQTVTAVGSIIVGNAEIHINKTIAQVRGSSPIFTAGATGTVDATDLSFDDANHDDTEGAYYCEIKNVGINSTHLYGLVGMGSSGRILYTFSGGNYFRAYDGANAITGPGVTLDADDTEYKIALAYGSGSQRVNTDDAWGTADTYDGVYNNSESSLNVLKHFQFASAASSVAFMRNLRRYDMSYDEAIIAIPDMMNGIFPTFGNKTGLGLSFGIVGKMGSVY